MSDTEYNKEIVNLQWAQWEEWFQKYNEYRDLYLGNLGSALFEDSKFLAISMKFFFKYVNAVITQCTLKIPEEEITKELTKIIDLYASKQNSLAIETSKKLYYKLEKVLMELKLTPKPEIEEKDSELSSLDDKTRSALEAWKLVYAVK